MFPLACDRRDMTRFFAKSSVIAGIVLAGFLAFGGVALAQVTLDTSTGPQVFGVTGTAVGDWDTTRLSVYNNLSVTGVTTTSAVQVGAGVPTCSAAAAGTMHYVTTPTPAHFEYCDGTAWQTFGGSKDFSNNSSVFTPGVATSPVYANSTGWPMAVNIYCPCPGKIVDHTLLVYVGGTEEVDESVNAGGGYTGQVSGMVIVPDGSNFNFVESGSGPIGHCTVVERW